MAGLDKKTYGREYMRSFKEGIRREWVISNGIGGYAGSSLIGANTRKHHGLLIASLHAPTNRRVILNRIAEEISFGDETYSLSSVQRKGCRYSEGFLYETAFSFDAVPEYTYFVKGTLIKKTIAMEYKKNTVAICYEIDNKGEDAVVSLVPSFNFRDHNAGSRKADLKFIVNVKEHEIELTPKSNPSVKIKFFAGNCVFTKNDADNLYDEKIELQTEIDTGMSSFDTGFTPYTISFGVKSNEKKVVSCICSIEDEYEKKARFTIKQAKERAKKLVENSGFEDNFLKRLCVNADNFIVDRMSTDGKTILAGYPWFTDWGRDTMIALTGLTLETKRFEDAKSILRTFAKYEKNGLIPNMFPDEDTDPLYNTADASLWYFYCIDRYLEYTNTEEAYSFVKSELYVCMKRIIEAYRNGTDFSIYMDKDGLIHAGSDLDQVTWMDVRVNGYVVTPRHGKPVEINALWYNALKVMENLAKRFGDTIFEDEVKELSTLTKDSFVRRFWNEERSCLYDVVDELGRDNVTISDNDAIRPNQIWAVSLPYTMLDREKEKAIVKKVLTKLCTDFGLRSLSDDDPDYKGRYEGKLVDRDMAYHQGTVWAYPMGAFISAFLKVNDYSDDARDYAKNLLKPFKRHLNDGCIGGIAEIFDGDAPFISRGCYTQAWSVGEIIRAYCEVIK